MLNSVQSFKRIKVGSLMLGHSKYWTGDEVFESESGLGSF